MKKLILLSISIVIALIEGSAQTGPGGVGNSSNNSLWLDASTLTEPNGNPITSWTDQSGNSNSATQLNVSSQPIMSTNQINSLPGINFDGSNDYLELVSSISDIGNTTFIVCNSRGSSYSSILALAKHHFSFGTGLIRAEHVDGRKIVEKSENSFSLSSFSTNSNPVSGPVFVTNSTLSRSYTRSGLYSLTNESVGALFYSGSFRFYFDGLISEIVVYNEELNSASRKIVSNYLAAKYSLISETNLYNYSLTHGQDLKGIGRESDGANLSAKGRDSLKISNASSLSDGEYLLIGHDGGAFTTSVSVPNGIVERWNRVWRADMTGNVGTIDLEFYLGTSGFAATNDYVILVENADGDFSNGGASFITNTPTLTSGVLKFTGVSIPDGAYFTLAESSGAISAIADGNWNSTSTWSSGIIPDSGSIVSIGSPFTVTIGANSSVKNLSIHSGGILSFSSSDTLSVFGNLTVAGSISAGTGTFSAKNKVLNQSFTNNTGSTVELNNFHSEADGGVSINVGNWAISANLQIEHGQLDVSNTTSFTLLSNSTSTSQILPSAENCFVGDFTIQRFISSRNSNYCNFSSPMIASTVNELDDDLYLSGVGGADGNATTSGGATFYSIKTFNRFTESHNNITSTSTILSPSVGYEIYLATTLGTFNATTVDLVGTPSVGQVSSVQVNQGWNLVGNPYHSFLSWTDVTKDASVPNDYYIFNTNNGSYDFISGGTDPIAPEQGFWINMLPQGGKLLTFNEDDKVSSNSSTFLRKKKAQQTSFIIKSNSNTFSTKTIINFDATASLKFDDLDAKFLSSPNLETPAIYSFPEGSDVRLTKNSVSPDEESLKIPLTIDIPIQGTYLIESENISTLLGNYSCAYLEDKENNTLIDFNFDNSVTFESESGESKRFNLILSNSFEECQKEILNNNSHTSKNKVLSLRNTNRSFYLDYNFGSESNNSLSIEILNINGQLVKSLGSVSVIGKGAYRLENLEGLKNGVYLIRVVGNTASLNEIIKI